MKRSFAYIFLYACLSYGVTSFNNFALQKSVNFFSYSPHVSLDTTKFTDGDTSTCESFTVNSFQLAVDLGTQYNLKSSKITFKGTVPVKNAIMRYHDRSYGWPYTVVKSYATEIPQTVEFDVQRVGQTIDFRVVLGNNVQFEICEIEMYGCAIDHYGSECRSCVKDDNCEVCDVNNGECYICKSDYTGPNCSKSHTNVALQQVTALRYQGGLLLSSYRLVDGRAEQPSCIDLGSFPDEKTVEFELRLLHAKSIRNIRMDVLSVVRGIGDILFNYTLALENWDTEIIHRYSGIERLDNNSIEILVPLSSPINSVNLVFTLPMDDVTGNLQAQISLCEVTVHEMIPTTTDHTTSSGTTVPTTRETTTVSSDRDTISTTAEISTKETTPLSTIWDATSSSGSPLTTSYTATSTTITTSATDTITNTATLATPTSTANRETTSTETVISNTNTVETTKARLTTKITSNKMESRTKEARKSSSQSLLTNTHFIVAVSVSIVGLVAVLFIVGVLVKKCKRNTVGQSTFRQKNMKQPRTCISPVDRAHLDHLGRGSNIPV